MRNLWMALLLCSLWNSTSHCRTLMGDSIGPNNSLTNNNAGVPATYFGENNHGMPAIQVDLHARDRLTRLDAVVFGTPSSGGVLDFSHFDYFLNIWSTAEYFAGSPPSKTVNISTGLENVTLGLVAPNTTRPIENFGVVGPLFPGTPTHLLSFDLTQLAELAQPLGLDSYVVAFQSQHDMDIYGLLSVSGSVSGVGPLPLFSVDVAGGTEVPRGIFGDQDPSAVTLRWGLNLSARLEGDYNDDGVVNSADFDAWKSSLGTSPNSSLNGVNADGNRNGIVDAADYTVWRDNSPTSGSSSLLNGAVAVPEPCICYLVFVAMLLWTVGSRASRGISLSAV